MRVLKLVTSLARIIYTDARKVSGVCTYTEDLKHEGQSMRKFCFVACLTLVFACAEQASAGTFNNSVVVDLSDASITNDGSGGQLILGFPVSSEPINAFTPEVGDILFTSIAFANGDRLKIIDGPNSVDSTGPNYFESLTFYFAGSGDHFTNTTIVAFTDLEGNLTDLTPGGSSNGILAQTISGDITDRYISFTGITLTTTILSLPNPGAQSYDHFGLFGGRAGGYEIISSGATVPEPSSIALSGLGAAGLAFGAYRKRRQAKLAA